MNEEDILRLIKEDDWMMMILHKAQEQNLPQWMIGAGFVRNKVWDYLHGINSKTVPTNDIDLIYFDKSNIDEKSDRNLSLKLGGETNFGWEVVNQAYAHNWHDRSPYKDVLEALSEWVETPTCVAVSLDGNGKLILHAPHGTDDLVNLIVRPSPTSVNSPDYIKRITSKKWKQKWPKLKILGL